MSPISSTVFAANNAGCCTSLPAAPAVPAVISNAAGLNAIAYRIGDFTSFRAAMLDALPAPDLLVSGATSLQSPVNLTDTAIQVVDGGPFPAGAPFQIKIDDEYLLVTERLTPTDWTVARSNAATHDIDAFVTLVPPNPFAAWHEGIDSDYQTMFVELWAYLGDVLTFYQERIANEAYLGTAVLRDSLLRLTALIDYRANPGAGAGGWVGFTVAPNRSLTIPAGFRVSGKASSGPLPVVFETAAPVLVAGDNNSIALAVLSPEVPYAPGTVVLQGAQTGISTGDFLLIFDVVDADTPESTNLVRVTDVEAGPVPNSTTIGWQDPAGVYQQASKSASVHAFRVKAAPFGFNAPLWDVLSPTFTNSNQQFTRALYSISWELRSIPALGLSAGEGSLILNDWYFIPVPTERTDQLYLDRLHSELKYSAANPGLAVLLTDDGVFQLLGVVDVLDTGKTGYAFAAQSTRLTFDGSINLHTFPLRSTVVLTGTEIMPLQISLPIPDPLTGATLTLAGIHTQLQDGQTVVLRGNLFDPSSSATQAVAAAEAAVLDGAPQPNPAEGTTTVNLKLGLANQYVHASCTLLGNVVSITQGETIGDEVLGSGDGSAFQTFPLKKLPLTYLPSTDPEGISAVESTLTVSVNGVEWTEQPNFASSGASDAVFVTTLDDSGQTTVVFGDGFNGSRPPTGVNNIHAHYRNGLGSDGNLPDGAVQKLVDSLTSLQKTANPIPTTGGADPESPAGIRTNAPGTLQTFGRAVSAADYAALASSYPGIAKASAAWIIQDAVTQQVAPHPYVQLTAATENRTPLQGTSLASNLRRFLDSHRDPNVLLRIQDFTPAYIAVTVEVAINPRFPHQATLNAVNAALNAGVNPDGSLGFFAFDRLQFGEGIYLSAVYAAVQAVPGIDNVVVTGLSRVFASSADAVSTTPNDIAIGATEVAVIDSRAVAGSVLTVTGKGGFAGS